MSEKDKKPDTAQPTHIRVRCARAGMFSYFRGGIRVTNVARDFALSDFKPGHLAALRGDPLVDAQLVTVKA